LLGVELYYQFIEGRAALPPIWNSTTSYLTGEIVSFGVDIWEALTDNLGVEPVEGTDWNIVQEGNQWLKLENGTLFNSAYGYPYGRGGDVDVISNTYPELIGRERIPPKFTYDVPADSSAPNPGYTTEWLGIKDMLTPYVWHQWTHDTFDSNTGIGIVQGKAENSSVIEPKRRLVDAWNEFVKKAHTMQDLILSEAIAEPLAYGNYCCAFEPWLTPQIKNTFGI